MNRRSHKTRWTVRLTDRLATVSITVGGLGTILAVTGVFLFLVSVVVPIFRSGRANPRGAPAHVSAPALQVGCDEYRVCGWSLGRDARWRAFRIDNGDSLRTVAVAPAESLAASSFDVESASLAMGMTDGSIRLFRVEFDTDYPEASELPQGLALATAGDRATIGDAVIERTAEGSLRRQRPLLTETGRVPAATSGPASAMSHLAGDDGFTIATLAADSLVIDRVSRAENEFTGEILMDVDRAAVGLPAVDASTRVMLAEGGAVAFVIDARGHTTAYQTRAAPPEVITSRELTDRPVTAAAMLIGRTTLLAGDESGDVHSWFLSDSPDGRALVSPRTFPGDGSAVRAIAGSPRDRLFLVGYESGRVRVFQATSGKRVVNTMIDPPASVNALAFAPKTDGLLVVAGGTLRHFNLETGHPELTLQSLFRPVWYEGYAAPMHAWQSSAGTDDFEPKLGLWPLVFGTLKATFYAMLFGVPIALLAAVFTSEFVAPSIRPRLKTLIESMASLPSVVLGFLAALVFAPFVQGHVPSVMIAFLVIPVTLLAGAYLWQTLPAATSRRLVRLRFPLALATLPVSIVLSAALGPWAERHLFAGNMMSWLDGQRGSGFGGWILLLISPAAAVVIFLMARLTGPRLRMVARTASRSRVAWMDLGRFLVGAMATLALAIAVAGVLTLLHADPRGGMLGTYVQRNALVVGFVMGFAIIPIIYTIAEDALSAVPSHLRAASLGAGATPWQTATRIVLPTAMSGLFSAIMIGLGRAVGETMIVLMAAGNTPVLQMNMFNGFRTLSANIAVELPEAVRDSSHYRTLFFAALLLFGITFIINTAAEMVRLRFRRRSAQI
jgi:phosphate transport system permease protein